MTIEEIIEQKELDVLEALFLFSCLKRELEALTGEEYTISTH